MSLISVPIFKTEDGVYTEAPVASDFNPHGLVGTRLEPKKVREIMIKFTAGSWVEQSVWSAGTVIAIETTHPGTFETAYLDYPINDFINSQCCSEPDPE